MKKLLLPVSMISMLLSCVNKDYDLNKLDTEMTFFGDEGIEIPIYGNESTEIKIIDEEIQPEMNCVAVSSVENVSLADISAEKKKKGVEVKGHFKFDLGNLPEVFRSPDNKIKFNGESGFTIEIDNECSAEMLMSCDICDATTDKLVGKLKDIPVSKGKGQTVYLPFSECGLEHLPDKVDISNIVIKEPATKASISEDGTITFGGATFDLKSTVLAGSCLKDKYEFSDVFKELEVDLSAFGENVSASQFTVKGTITSDLPLNLSAVASGDLSTEYSINFPVEEQDLTIGINCKSDMASAKQAILILTVETTSDLDLSKIDSYRFNVDINGIRFEEGITVKL